MLLVYGKFRQPHITQPAMTDTDKYPPDLITSPKPEVLERDWNKVGVYHDPLDHYRVDYPAGNFTITPGTDAKEALSGIRFFTADAYREISIHVFSTHATTSALQALLDRKWDNGKSQRMFEKNITIDGNIAVVGHWTWWDDKEFPERKTLFFVKDQKLYVIETAYVDHERIWNSFKFE